MRLYKILMSLTAITTVGLMAGTVEADTAFLLSQKQSRIFGATLDSPTADGAVVINQRGVRKESVSERSGLPGAWTSGYGSVTFNQLGREFPLGGLNQAGLVVQALWRDDAKVVTDSPRVVLDSLQWVQYCLDSFENVAQVAQSASASKVGMTGPFHFLACDVGGVCAMIEEDQGKLVMRSAEELPLPLLTGATYRENIDALNLSLGYGGDPAEPEGDGSTARFIRTTQIVNAVRLNPKEPLTVDRAFNALDSVATTKSTQWKIVYDMTGRKVYFTTSKRPTRAVLDLMKLSFKCGPDSLVTDINGAIPKEQKAPALTPFNAGENTKQISAVASKIDALAKLPKSAWAPAATYPGSLTCAEKPPMLHPADPAAAPTR